MKMMFNVCNYTHTNVFGIYQRTKKSRKDNEEEEEGE
jgi:hypothetical protein